MRNLLRNNWDNPKNHSRPYHRLGKKNASKKDSAVKSLLFKILSVLVIGYFTKKIRERKS